MTHIQTLIYIVVFLAFICLSWTSISLFTDLVNLIAAAIEKEGFHVNTGKRFAIFAISSAIVMAYLLF